MQDTLPMSEVQIPRELLWALLHRQFDKIVILPPKEDEERPSGVPYPVPKDYFYPSPAQWDGAMFRFGGNSHFTEALDGYPGFPFQEGVPILIDDLIQWLSQFQNDFKAVVETAGQPSTYSVDGVVKEESVYSYFGVKGHRRVGGCKLLSQKTYP